MTRTNGSLARTLDFEDSLDGLQPNPRGPAPLRLARGPRLRGADKYKALEARRRQAQIRARRLLDLLDAQECGR